MNTNYEINKCSLMLLVCESFKMDDKCTNTKSEKNEDFSEMREHIVKTLSSYKKLSKKEKLQKVNATLQKNLIREILFKYHYDVWEKIVQYYMDWNLISDNLYYLRTNGKVPRIIFYYQKESRTIFPLLIDLQHAIIGSRKEFQSEWNEWEIRKKILKLNCINSQYGKKCDIRIEK